MRRPGFSVLAVALAACFGAPAWAQYTGGSYDGHAIGEASGIDLGPTLVELASFEASGCSVDRCVAVQWQTASEIDSAGFHLWRSSSHDGPYVRITDTLIGPRGDLWHGASYSYLDQDVACGRRYFYKIEDVDYDGRSTFLGPVSVQGPVL